jgi:peroxiredoxin
MIAAARQFVRFAAAATVFATAGTSRSATSLAPGQVAPAFSTKDAAGRPVAVPVAGQPILLFFANQSTAGAIAPVTTVVSPRHPDAVVYSVIDLTSVPRALRGFARSQVRAKQRDAVKAAADSWRAAGKSPPADLDEQIHLVPDFDGKIAARYGINGAGASAHLVIIDRQGRVVENDAKVPSATAVGETLDAMPPP